MATTSATIDPPQDTVCVVTLHDPIAPNETVVLPDESQGREWLSDSIADDPTKGEYQWTEYKKLVCEPIDDPNATVYGTIETVPYTELFNSP